jgi:hypothetical protein
MTYTNTPHGDDEEPYRPMRRMESEDPWVVFRVFMLVVLFLSVMPIMLAYTAYERAKNALTPTDPEFPKHGMSQEDKKWWISTLIGVLVLVGLGAALAIYCALRGSGGA